MTKKELLEYYRENKNLCNEILLIGNTTGTVKIFRKYMEVYTCEDEWLAIREGVIYHTDDILDCFHIPNGSDIFKKI